MPTDRASYAGMLPPDAFNQRNRIAQTMMNIGNPPPQVSASGMPPGFRMAETPLKSLMGIEPGMSPGFMGGQPTPMPGMTPPAAAPPPPMQGGATGPMPLAPQTAPPVDPSSLFDAPPAVPGQTPPQFAKPPVF